MSEVACHHTATLSRTAGWISPTIAVDGRIVGVWRHDRIRGGVELTVETFVDLPRDEEQAVEVQRARMSRLLERVPQGDAEMDGA